MSEEVKANVGQEQEYVNLSNELNQEVVDLLAQIPDEDTRAAIYSQAYDEYMMSDNTLPLVDVIRKKIAESKQIKVM